MLITDKNPKLGPQFNRSHIIHAFVNLNTVTFGKNN